MTVPLSALRLTVTASFWFRNGVYTVRSTGIRRANDAFRTRFLESLHAESGEPPLSLQRNFFISSYSVKLSTQPHLPSYSADFRSSHHDRYGLNIRAAKPMSQRFHCILERLDIRLSLIVPNKLSRPTFVPHTSKVPPSTHRTRERRNMYPYVFRLFDKLTSTYRGYTVVCTENQLDTPSLMKTEFSNSASTDLIVYIRLNFTPSSKRFSLFGNDLKNVTFFAQTLKCPAVFKGMCWNIWSLWRFYKCSTSARHRSLPVFTALLLSWEEEWTQTAGNELRV